MKTQSFMIPAGTKLAKYQKRSGKRLKKRVRQKIKQTVLPVKLVQIVCTETSLAINSAEHPRTTKISFLPRQKPEIARR